MDVAADSANNYYTLTYSGEMSLAIQKHNFLTNKVEWTLPPSFTPLHANEHIALCLDENYGYVISRGGSGNQINDLIQRFDLQIGAWILYPGLTNGVININSYDASDPKANLEFPPISAKGIACYGGKLYVANTVENTGNGRVVKFDEHGRFLSEEYSEYTQAVWVDSLNPFICLY